MYIHNIITKDIGLISYPLEPFVYTGKVDGESVLLLCQVDDFAVSAKNKKIINKLLDKISEKLKQPLKRNKILDFFNWLEVLQIQNYIRILCWKYIEKILSGHGWLYDSSKKVTNPMKQDNATLQKLALSIGPSDPDQIAEL